ncbi:hypothetical protein HF313_20045 [Massilia atriviolacea]|uniref:Porin n=1 Tax=Massilia atriviolacea TaxID=2495579 RepID=A0A430HSF3_9BURK|nr:DUF1302 family protein [Massilia atriviolacea]RSZ60409.1 hypothetical protein EJB06_04655 [Massilia atriviolacea]
MNVHCRAAYLACGLAFGSVALAQDATSAAQLAPSENIDLSGDDKVNPVTRALRTTLGHQGAYLVRGDKGVVNQRSWLRLEYAKFFLDSFYVQLDSKLNGFWKKDHRARAENRSTLFDTMTPEAFLQYSAAGGQTSVKVGIQKIIWGESEAGAITDEVSPRNYSELFLVPLEESRLGQMMVSVDHFTSYGDLSLFYVPKPKFNRYAAPRSAYDTYPFNGTVSITEEESGANDHEFGMRWKKTFGKSDISFMAASLIDNNYGVRVSGVNAAGEMELLRSRQRTRLAGVTFNYTRGHFLVKGESAYKTPKDFAELGGGLTDRDVVDSSLGVTYALGQSNTIGLEAVNSHVRDWSESIMGIPKNANSLVLNANFLFMNDNLSVNWLTIRSRPYSSIQSSLRTSYKWNDNTTFSIDAHLIDAQHPKSQLVTFRQRDQIVFRVQYQF